MKLRNNLWMAAAATAYLWSHCALAHHSPAMFDRRVEVRLEGTITELAWRNPHAYMVLEITGADGKPVAQQVELGPASLLLPLGATPESLRRGDRVALRAYPSRSGPGHIVLGLAVTKSDGTVFALHPFGDRGPIAARDARATSIVGTWVEPSAGFLGLAAQAASWPVTERASKARKSADRQAMQAAMSECIPVGPPTLMVYPVVRTIDADDSSVTLDLDWMNGVRRVVHLDEPAHPTHAEPTLLGHSIGRWEDDVLVVDTAGFTAHPEGMGFETPSGLAKHAVERFSVSADRMHLDYEVTVEDPEFFTAPVTYRTQWQYRPDLKLTGVPCDAETARRFLTGE